MSEANPDEKHYSDAGETAAANAAGLRRAIEQLPRELTEALSRLAVPRWFDRDVARAMLPSNKEFDSTFDKIVGLSVVSSISRGRYIIHSLLREVLLQDLRKTPELRRELEHMAYSVFRDRYSSQISEKETIIPDQSLSLESLYHLLSIDQQHGLESIMQAFDDCVNGYDLLSAESLSKLLRDAGHEQWSVYYSAQLALLRGDLDATRSRLKEIVSPPPNLVDYIEVTNAQADIASGAWQDGIQRLIAVSRRRYPLPQSDIVRRSEELIARAYMGLALDAGGWIETEAVTSTRVMIILDCIGRLFLMPLHVVVYIALIILDQRELQTAITRYGTNLANVPIFDAYRRSLAAIKRARKISSPSGSARLRIDITYADLMKNVGNLSQATSIYARLVEQASTESEGKYRTPNQKYVVAVLQDNLSRAYLSQFRQTRNPDLLTRAQDRRDAAHSIYELVGGEYDLARVHLLQSEIAFLRSAKDPRQFDLMVESLERGLSFLEQRQDAKTLLDEGRSLAYNIRSTANVPPDFRDRIDAVIGRIRRKVYAVRIPNLFEYLQIAGIFLPVGLLITIFFLTAGRIHSAPRMGEITHLAEIIVTQGPFILILTWGAVLAVFTLVGISALVLAMRFQLLARLEYIAVTELEICRDRVGSRMPQCIPFDQVIRFAQITRRTGYTVSRSWSYSVLQTDHETMKIPATTAHYNQLISELSKKLSLTDKPPSQPLFEITLLYGAIVPAAFLGLAFSIFLTLNRVWGVSVDAHVWLSILANAAVRLMILVVMGKYIWHFIRVEQITRNSRTFRVVSVVLAVIFLLLGVPGQKESFPASLDFVYWSALLFAGFMEELENRVIPNQAIGSVLKIVVVGLLSILVVRSIVTELLVTEAFTYANAVIGANDETLISVAEPDQVPIYFERMKETAIQLILINPQFADGYTYYAASAFYEERFQVSATAFEQAIMHNGMVVDPNLYLCQSLAYDQLGLSEESQDMLTQFAATGYCDRGFSPWCPSLFPQLTFTCEGQ